MSYFVHDTMMAAGMKLQLSEFGSTPKPASDCTLKRLHSPTCAYRNRAF